MYSFLATAHGISLFLANRHRRHADFREMASIQMPRGNWRTCRLYHLVKIFARFSEIHVGVFKTFTDWYFSQFPSLNTLSNLCVAQQLLFSFPVKNNVTVPIRIYNYPATISELLTSLGMCVSKKRKETTTDSCLFFFFFLHQSNPISTYSV